MKYNIRIIVSQDYDGSGQQEVERNYRIDRSDLKTDFNEQVEDIIKTIEE